jgi:parallel beta-helix repeat protein
MSKRTVRSIVAVGIAMIAVPAWVTGASAAGAVNISTCQTLNIANTVYKLTANLTSCGTCLVVANNRITVDLQGHSITGDCGGGSLSDGAAVGDEDVARDVTTVRNGSVSGFFFGVGLGSSTNSQVLNVTASDNVFGIVVGSRGLVKSCSATNNGVGIAVNDHGQVEQCVASFNVASGIVAFDHCLITRNTANSNGEEGIAIFGGFCTVTFNTANNNDDDGIDVGGDGRGGSGNLVSHNTATGNGDIDYDILCPSTVTFNKSEFGFPDSYFFGPPGVACQASNNQ